MRPDLKLFDPLAQGYAAAPTEPDRVIILGDILDLTAAFLANYQGGIYQQAVQMLQTAGQSGFDTEVCWERQRHGEGYRSFLHAVAWEL